MKLGDKVRFVSEVGGGIITGFQGKDIVLVEDADGFEIPMLRNEVVVIDMQKEDCMLPQNEQQKISLEQELEPCDLPITFHAKPMERVGGNVLHAMLAITPSIQHERVFDLHIINDSNYQLHTQLLRQQGMGWMMVWSGTIQPNTKIKIHEVDLDEANLWEYLCCQLLACKEERTFALQPAVSTEVRIQPTKFFKQSTFKSNPFFSKDAWIIEII